MELDEYLWRNKIRQWKFAQKLGIMPHSLSRIVQKKVTPKLYVAVKIVEATEGQVSYRELLRPEDEKLMNEG